MDRAFLVKSNPAIEIPCGTEQVQHGLAVVAFVRVINFRLGKEEHLRAEGVPLDLRSIGLEEGLLASGWRIKGQKAVYFDVRWGTLTLPIINTFVQALIAKSTAKRERFNAPFSQPQTPLRTG